jgi:hypothetical protein
MPVPQEFRHPDTFARIRSLLTTLQLRIDIYGREHGCSETDAAFLESIHQDIARLAEIVQEKRQAPRVGKTFLDPTTYLAQSS